MVNVAVLSDYNDKFVGVVGHDYTNEQVFYKVTNQFLDNLLEQLFGTKVYETVDEDGMEYLEEVTKSNKHYLETILTKLELYKVQKYYEDKDGNLKDLVKSEFDSNAKK
jgi:hypothetical protein